MLKNAILEVYLWLQSGLFNHMEITASLEHPVQARISQEIKVPIKEKLAVPVEAIVSLDTTVNTVVDVPLDLKLDQDDLEMSQLAIEVDQDILVDDEIEIDMGQLLDSLVDLDKTWVERLKKALPIHKKAKLKIQQPLRIKGTLSPKISTLNLHLKKTLVLDLTVPIKQTFPIKTTASVDLDSDIITTIDSPVAVALERPLSIKLLDITLKK